MSCTQKHRHRARHRHRDTGAREREAERGRGKDFYGKEDFTWRTPHHMHRSRMTGAWNTTEATREMGYTPGNAAAKPFRRGR